MLHKNNQHWISIERPLKICWKNRFCCWTAVSWCHRVIWSVLFLKLCSEKLQQTGTCMWVNHTLVTNLCTTPPICQWNVGAQSYQHFAHVETGDLCVFLNKKTYFKHLLQNKQREKRERGSRVIWSRGRLEGWGDVVVVVGLGGRDVGVAGSKVCLRCKSDEDFWKG